MTMSGEESTMARSIDIFDKDTLALALSCLREQDKAVVSNSSFNSSHMRLSIDFVRDSRIVNDRSLEALVHALSITSKPIQEVRYEYGTMRGVRAFRSEWTGRLCDTIGCLPNLRSLHWCTYGYSASFSMDDLARTLHRARNLVSLCCTSMDFDATTAHFAAFIRAFEGHSTLREVRFSDCNIPRSSDALLDALSTIPNLTELSLSCWLPSDTSASTTSSLSLSRLCAHPKLTKLDITGSEGRDIVSACRGIQRSNTLTTLSMSTFLDEADLLPLSKMLRTHQFLKKLTIHMGIFEDDQHMRHLISALEVNSTLTELTFIFRGWDRFFSNGIQDALVAMLEEKNFSLLSVNFDLASYPEVRNRQTEDMMEYYLSLNRFGRKALLENPTTTSREMWVSTLATASKSLDALFYFLSLNPTLVE